MRPLCRILSISDADLQTMAILSVMILDHPVDLRSNVVHGKIAVHRDQPSLALIVILYRTSLLLVSRQPRLNDFQAVVIAGHQLRPVEVEYFLMSGRLEVEVVDRLLGGISTSSSDQMQRLLIIS